MGKHNTTVIVQFDWFVAISRKYRGGKVLYGIKRWNPFEMKWSEYGPVTHPDIDAVIENAKELSSQFQKMLDYNKSAPPPYDP